MQAPSAEAIQRGYRSVGACLTPPSVRELLPHLNRRIKQGDELWQLWRRACADSLYFAAKTVLAQIPPERNLIRWRTHGAICLLVQDDAIKDLLIEFPRKALKSTLATCYGPIHHLMRVLERGGDPYHRHFIISHTMKGVADRHWSDIKSTIENGAFLRFLYPEIRPGKKWNEQLGYIERPGYDPKDPTFEPLADRSAGKHCDWLIADDLIDEINFRNPGAVEVAIGMWRFGENWLEGADSRRMVVGNRWGLLDLNATVHREARDNGTVVLSVNAETGPNLTGEWACKNLPDYLGEPLEALRLTAERHGTIWPERFTKKYLAGLRKKLREKVYSAQFLNRPEDPAAAEFDVRLVGRTQLVKSEEQGWVIVFRDRKHALPLSECNVYVSWDPALDEKYSTSENAVLVTAVTPAQEKVVLREHVRRESPYRSLETFIRFVRAFQPWLHATGMEEVLFQRVMKTPLSEAAEARNVFLGLRKVQTSTSRSREQEYRGRIGIEVEQARLYVDEACPKTFEQLRIYGTEGAPDDAISALVVATKLWRRPATREELEEQQEIEEEHLHDGGVCGYGTTLAVH